MTGGVLLGSPVPFFMGVLLLFFCFLQLGLLTYGLSRVRLIREHAAHAVCGESIQVRLRVGNFSRVTLPDVWLCERVEPSGVLEESLHLAEAVPPNRAYRIEYACPVTKRRGRYSLGPGTVFVRDGFGIFTRYRTLPELTPLCVYPTPVTGLADVPLLAEAQWQRIGEEIVSSPGFAGEFRGARAFRRGDTLSRIHWKATARYGEFIVKDFDVNATTSVGVFVDFRQSSLRGMGTHTTHEAALGLAAAVLARAVEYGHALHVVFAGARGTSSRSGSGPAFLHLVLNDMVDIRPSWTRSGFLDLIRAPLGRLPYGSTAVFEFGGLACPLDDLAELGRQCRLRRLSPIAVLLDDRQFLRRDTHHMVEERDGLSFEALADTYRGEGFTVVPVQERHPAGSL